MKNRYRIFVLLTIFLPLFLTGCARIERVIISIPEDLEENFSELIKSYPLPERILLTTAVSAKDTGKIILYKSSWLNRDIPDTGKGASGSILLSRTIFAPTTDFLDVKTGVSLEYISLFPVVPIEEVHLPEKALAVDGLYPGDEDYPLISEIFLSVKAAEGSLLEGWFAGISGALQHDLLTKKEKIIWIGGVGDMMLQRGIEDTFFKKGVGPVFHDTLKPLQELDLLLGNLEGAVTTGDTQTPKSYNFRFRPESLSYLQEAGFDYLSITNNHCYDFGTTGFTDTLDHLKAKGIGTSGAGRSPDEAAEPWKTQIEHLSVSVLSFGAYPEERNGFNGEIQAAVTSLRPGILWNTEETLQTISQAANPDSFDIIMVHGGHEWRSQPSDEQRNLCRQLVDSGVELVLGSHPHVLQGVEAYEGALIAYSLGNFLFNGMGEMPFAEESLILSVGIYKNQIRYVRFIPVEIDGPSIALDSSGKILPRFLALSKNLRTK